MTDVSMAAQGEDPAEETAEQSMKVIATICMTPDGQFVLYEGDEPEEIHNAEEAPGEAAAPAGEAGAAPAGGAGPGGAPEAGAEEQAGGEEAPEGEVFDNSAQLMRAVLEVVKSAEESAGGGEDAAFEKGYAEDGPEKAAPPVKPKQEM